jgi:thioredoxin 1
MNTRILFSEIQTPVFLKSEDTPRQNRFSLVLPAVLLAVILTGAGCGSKASSGEPAAPPSFNSASTSPNAAKVQSAAEGTVLVTDNLDIDFSKHLITFIELGADKCIPCKAMQPIMKEIAAEYKGQVQVVFYDVWKNPEPGRKYGIQLIPTQVFMDKTGKEISRHVGLFPKPELVEFLKKQGIR